MTAPQFVLDHRMFQKQGSGCTSFKDLNCTGHRNRRRNRNEQVNMIRLNFDSNNWPGTLVANISEQRFETGCYIFGENLFSVLRTPYNVICCLISAVAIAYDIHYLNSTLCFEYFQGDTVLLAFLPWLKPEVSGEVSL